MRDGMGYTCMHVQTSMYYLPKRSVHVPASNAPTIPPTAKMATVNAHRKEMSPGAATWS